MTKYVLIICFSHAASCTICYYLLIVLLIDGRMMSIELAKMESITERILPFFCNHDQRVLARTDYSYTGIDVDCMLCICRVKKKANDLIQLICHCTQMRKEGLIQWLK